MDMSESKVIADLLHQIERLSSQGVGTFLTSDEVATLTGRKTKSRQIEALRRMGVAFFINDIGHPVIARSVIEGKKAVAPEKPKWVPKVLRTG
jgi:hypothetical protein